MRAGSQQHQNTWQRLYVLVVYRVVVRTFPVALPHTSNVVRQIVRQQRQDKNESRKLCHMPELRSQMENKLNKNSPTVGAVGENNSKYIIFILHPKAIIISHMLFFYRPNKHSIYYRGKYLNETKTNCNIYIFLTYADRMRSINE